MLAVLPLPLLAASPFVAASSDAVLVAALGPLLPRQQQQPPTMNVPSQCKPTCDPVNALVASGNCPPSSCCNADFVNGYFNCFKCVGTALNVSSYAIPQATLDLLVATCMNLGFNVPKPILPGIDPNHSLSGLASTRSATSSAASSAAPPPTLPLTTLAITSTAPPIVPPIPPTSAVDQSTITSIDPLSTQTPQGATPTNTPNGGLITHRLSAPQFSHLIILSAMFVGFACFVV